MRAITSVTSAGAPDSRRRSLYAHAHRLVALLAVPAMLTGCGNDAHEQAARPEPTVDASPTETQMAQWRGSCALCHADGTAGAPRLGVDADWAPRLARGEDVLLSHTLEGYNDMPPLGYCMSCTADDFRALIHFMSHSGAGP